MFNDTDIMNPLIPFDDTYILYDPEDAFSIVSAYLALTPILVLQFYLSWLIITRELEAVLITVGQLCNEILNKILKRIIRQPRPSVTGPGYGMPSAHAQFMAFVTVYMGLTMYHKWSSRTCARLVRWCYFGALLVLGVMVCLSRVYLHYHSVRQVVVGYAIGAFTGSLYYLFINAVHATGVLQEVVAGAPDVFHMKDTWNTAPTSLAQQRAHWLSSMGKQKSE